MIELNTVYIKYERYWRGYPINGSVESCDDKEYINPKYIESIEKYVTIHNKQPYYKITTTNNEILISVEEFYRKREGLIGENNE